MSPKLFSLGGLLAREDRLQPLWLPWAVVAVGLLAGALWDLVARGGRADFVLLGLAGYELVIGLTEEK